MLGWILVLLLGSGVEPEKLEVNPLWPRMLCWALSCSLAALSVMLSDVRYPTRNARAVLNPDARA